MKQCKCPEKFEALLKAHIIVWFSEHTIGNNNQRKKLLLK